jgi:hypothetical protein
MPPKPRNTGPKFEFELNPEKSLAPRTIATYKSYLNKLAEKGIKNKNDILSNPQKVVDIVKEIGDTKIKRNYLFGAIFYVTGRQDFEKDPRGLPIFKAFQENYKS